MNETPIDNLLGRAVRIVRREVQPIQGNPGTRGERPVVDIRAQVGEIGFVGPVILRVNKEGGVANPAL